MTRLKSLKDKLNALPWQEHLEALDSEGHTILPGLLSQDQCLELQALYPQPALFRKRIIMEQRNYGRGEYQYFTYPLPGLVQQLRESLYEPLQQIANRWAEALHCEYGYPAALKEYLARCHGAGQQRPTPLMLRYRAGDFNCMHQDLYGAHAFPVQVVFLLSQPGKDFEGGEFILTEQRPRMQSRARVVPLAAGDAVAFAVNQRPESGPRGYRRVTMKHGVSTVRSGNRYTLGIIFHDAA